jgi:hypothetical protein
MITRVAATNQMPALTQPRVEAASPVNIGLMYSPEMALELACISIARRTLPPLPTTIQANTTAAVMM